MPENMNRKTRLVLVTPLHETMSKQLKFVEGEIVVSWKFNGFKGECNDKVGEMGNGANEITGCHGRPCGAKMTQPNDDAGAGDYRPCLEN